MATSQFLPPISDAAWFSGKRVMVVGLARSGYAAVRLLQHLDAFPIVIDCKTQEQLAKTLGKHGTPGCPCFFGVDPLPLLSGMEAVVISPAAPINAPLVLHAQANGIPVIGELELGFLASKGQVTAITGTNGKTTTVTLLGEILKAAGRTAHVCGNIGYPISAAAMDAQASDDLVVEVSSFQLETAFAFHPKVAVLLNITPDHLNRHGDMATYTALKYHLFVNQTAQDVTVLNADDPLCVAAQAHTRAQVHWFSMQKAVRDGAYADAGMIWLARNGKHEAVCRTADLLIPGRHNVMNALAAVATAGALGVPAQSIAKALREFTGVEHRIEFVLEIDGVRYLNDSKGTNPDSTMRAVEAMDRATVILLGGQDKGTSFRDLASCIRQSPWIRHAVLIGETAKDIEVSLKELDFTAISRAGNLQDAVQIARKHAAPGSAVLLSPACASFDMFDDYEQRGRIFKDIVRSLAAGISTP